MIEQYDFTNFWEAIDKTLNDIHQKQEQELAEIIDKYDFMVGSAELKEKLESILPYGANVVYSKYVKSPTTIFAIKKFNGFDLSFKPFDNGNY